MAKAGSVDYGRKGGFCCSCNCMSCYGKCGGCDYNNEVYIVKEDRIIFGEEPGPGVCCLLSSVFFPVTYLIMLLLSAAKSLNGLVFVAQDGVINCTIYSKKACYEEDSIVLDHVVDFDVKKRLKSITRQTKNGFVTTHYVLVCFSITYMKNGELDIHVTPEQVRTDDTYEEDYYHAFRDDVRKFIRQNDPSGAHSAGAAADNDVGEAGEKNDSDFFEPDEVTRKAHGSSTGYELTPV